MKLEKAIEVFKGEVKKALELGYEVQDVIAEFGDDEQLLITAMSHNSVLVAVYVDRRDLLMGLTEYVFASAADGTKALHKLKTMSCSSGTIKA